MTRTTENFPNPVKSKAWTAVMRCLAGLAVVTVTTALAVVLTALSNAMPQLLPSNESQPYEAYSSIPQFLRWLGSQTTEAQFFKTELGGLGMLLGGWVAHIAWKRGRRWAGFPISYGTGLWPWAVGSALLGLLLSDLAWGWTSIATGTSQPTFVPFVSVSPAVVLVYGAGWSVAVTGAVLGAALTTPIALLAVNFVCHPLGLPAVTGSVTGMWGGALIAFLLARRLPWMPPPGGPFFADRPDEAGQQSVPASASTASSRHGPGWVVRRVLADFTEAPFYGNEIAAVGLIAGTVLAYVLNLLTPVQGSGLLPAVLTAQALTATIGILLYHRRWADAGSYPTFVPVVSVAPATVLAYGPTVQAIVVGAVLGALAGPPLAAQISKRLPPDFHPFIGNVLSMTICTLTIIPLLSILPGFTAVT
ncbi:hypothetical protein E1288_38005 [Saccharopolyspora elongata]|uniref:Uncharacterized protein n=2 Tax=Saccharopolyspora elongata TaxID=2530387 RepID=A0A4R4Y378_9PSEU|nr:hypothetical protein E1288_38005 [Saccharopolyspora elongata]